MTDIIEDLDQALNDGMRPGTADSDINTFDLPVTVKRALLHRAMKEIRMLRAAAGVVTDGASFREIKQEIKNGV